ncbi:MAG: hypothetical protein AAFO69_06465, partial [Bacteroidota bacterium]
KKSTLKQQMDDIVQNGRTYNQFKVIPSTTIQQLFSQITDTLAQQRLQIARTREMAEQQAAIAVTEQARSAAIQKDLDASVARNESISFLGIDFQKSTYNLLVWSLIVLLTLAALSIYWMYARSHKLIKNAQSDLSSLNGEFESYKTKSHEKQVKLKRELQTAMNTLHEKGIKI